MDMVTQRNMEDIRQSKLFDFDDKMEVYDSDEYTTYFVGYMIAKWSAAKIQGQMVDVIYRMLSKTLKGKVLSSKSRG